MRRRKCFVIEHRADGVTTTKTSYDPFSSEVRTAKERILVAAGSGEAITICVVEHVNSKTFSTDGKGTVKVRY
jgi:hypothetical protein